MDPETQREVVKWALGAGVAGTAEDAGKGPQRCADSGGSVSLVVRVKVRKYPQEPEDAWRGWPGGTRTAAGEGPLPLRGDP